MRVYCSATRRGCICLRCALDGPGRARRRAAFYGLVLALVTWGALSGAASADAQEATRLEGQDAQAVSGEESHLPRLEMPSPSVEGEERFVLAVRYALAAIEAHPDPSWKEIVYRNLAVIRPAHPGELPPGAAGGMLVSETGGIAIFAPHDVDSRYLASEIVHEAWHYRQYAANQKYYGAKAEREALRVQATFISQMAPDHPSIPILAQLAMDVGDAKPLPGNPPR